MELRHLRYFVKVAETLSMRRSAEELHLSQPTLSRQIQDLEEEVGAELFLRHRQGLELTTAGQYFLNEARLVLTQSDHAIKLARAASLGQAGVLKIGYNWAICDPVMLRALRLFQKRFPLLELHIEEMTAYEQLEGLVQNKLDFAYLGFRFPEFEKTIQFELIRKVPMCIALPPGHSLSRRKTIRLRELADEEFIAPPSKVVAYRDWLTAICAEAGFTPRFTQEANNSISILSLVSAGFGVAFVPESFVNFKVFDVEVRKLSPSFPQLEVHIAWRKNNPSLILKLFLDSLKMRRVDNKRG